MTEGFEQQMDNIALVQPQAGLGSNLLIQNSGTTRQFHSFSFALISYQLNREKNIVKLTEPSEFNVNLFSKYPDRICCGTSTHFREGIYYGGKL